MKKLKLGIVGAGHLGKIHIKCAKQIDKYDIVGFHDIDINNSQIVENEFQIKYFDHFDQLLQLVDVIDIVTPTVSHYQFASASLKNFKHVFIEKPIVATLNEASSLIKIAYETGMKVQIGHVERYNPAFLAAKTHLNKPMFIEAHRLAQFNPRGTDVPVVLDLMIHDIDIILSVVKSDVKKINSSGVAVISQTPDIANARIEFNNGCVANLTASRISLKNMRKARFFQNNAYIAVDFLNKTTEIFKLKDVKNEENNPFAMIIDLKNSNSKKQIFYEKPEIIQNNAILEELESFADSIINDTTPKVTIYDGYNALDIAYQIINKM